jgi:hypothetical protein
MAERVQGKRDIPMWAAIAVVAVGLLGAGWFIWSQTSGFWSGRGGVFTIEGVPAKADTPPRTYRPPQVQTFVRQVDDNNWRARAGVHTLIARRQNGVLNVSMQTFSQKSLPADSQWMVMARGRLSTTGKDLGLTKQQIAAIRALPTSPTFNVALTTDQRQALTQAMEKYLTADAAQKPAADREVAQKLAELGKETLPTLEEGAKKAYSDLQASMGPDQWSKLKAIATAVPSATTAPTPAPAQ